MRKNRYNKILNHLKSEEINQKINFLNEKMTTTGLYLDYGMDSGVPAVPEIPAIPAVPPTYENVVGGLSNPNDFVWGDQGDGSDPNAPVNIPANLYTTYNGEQVAAARQIEGTYPEGVTPLGYVVGFSWLSTYPVGYLTADGPQFIASAGVFGNASTDLGRSYQSAFNNWPFPGKIEKTIYFWGSLDCLFGTCRGASQYYPSNLSNTSTPKADRALYAYTLWIPADANGNVLPNRIMTDPGSPEVPAIPGVPAIPPKQVIIGRNNLGDPRYYPMQPQSEIAQMGPNQVYPLLDIVRKSPPGQTRNNAIQQLDQWAKPGSKNREILIKLGVPLEGASLPSSQGNIAADYTNGPGGRVLGPHTDVKYDKQMKMYVPAHPRPGALPVRVGA